MATLSRRKKSKENLIATQTYITDRSANSPSYFVINNYPTEFTSGKNAIRLFGTQSKLKPGSEIFAEVLDAAGNPVYSEINNYTDQHNNFVISVWVYDDAIQGIGSITLLGTALVDENNIPVPAIWRDRPNIKWTRQITISPTKRNDSEILFERPPRIGLAQVILPYNEVVGTTSSLAAATTANLTQFVFLDTNLVSGDSKEYTFDIATQTSIFNPRQGQRRVAIDVNLSPQSQTQNTVDGTIAMRNKDIFNGVQYPDIAAYNTVLTIATASVSLSLADGSAFNYSGGFTDDMIGSRVEIAQIGTKLPATASGLVPNVNTDEIYTSDVVDVIDSHKMVLRDPYVVDYSVVGKGGILLDTKHKYKTLTNATASITYRTPPNYVASTTVSQSFYYFTMEDLSPISGDVYRIKTYIKETGKYGDYELLGDNIVQAPEVLVDENTLNDKPYKGSLFKWYGNLSLSNVQSYWRLLTDTGTNINEVTTGIQAYTASVPQLNSYVVDLERYETLNSVTLDSLLFEIKQSEFFKADQIYRVTFKATADFESSGTAIDDCTLEIYASSEQLLGVGTGVLPRAFDPSKNIDKTSQRGIFSRYGKLLGRIKASKGSGRYKSYGRVSFEFQSDREGIGKLLLRVKSGAFHISEVSITPAVNTGFTPNLLTYALPLNAGANSGITSVSQSLDFKFEFFDYLGRQSDYVTFIPSVQVNQLEAVPSLGCLRTMISEEGAWPDVGFTTLLPFYDFKPIDLSYAAPSPNQFPGGYPNPDYQPPSPQVISTNYWVDIINGSGKGTANYPQIWGWNYQRYSGSYYTGSYQGTSSMVAYTALAASDPTQADLLITDPTITFGGTGGLNGTATLQPFSNNWNHSSSWVEGYHSSSQDQCACIARNWVSESWKRFDALGGSYGSSVLRTTANTYLKQNRLYWPATTGSTTAARTQYTPFTQNGGIYRVRFKLLQTKTTGPGAAAVSYAATNGVDQFEPAGDGAVLNIYIYDVGAGAIGATTAAALQPGIASWYPADNNIFKIRYSDIASTLPLTSSYLQYETYLVQWGQNGRLVFEASGSNNQFFGICIDDVEVCQIGTTTDPNYIAPPSYIYEEDIYLIPVPPPPGGYTTGGL